MSKRPVPFWLIALAVFFLLLCSYLIVPGYATVLENPPGAAVLHECSSLDEDSGEGDLPSDASASSQQAPEDISMDEDPGEAGFPSYASESAQEAPEATSVDVAPAEGGLPSDGSGSSLDVSEATSVDVAPAEGGLPSDGSGSSPDVSEATSVDDDPAEGGLPSGPAFLKFSDFVSLQSEDSAEGGLPSDASSSTQEAPEDTSVDVDPAEGGLPSDAFASTQEVPEETSTDEDPGAAGEHDSSVSTETDLQALNQSVENVHADLWLLLFTLWGFAGIFLGYKVGGVVLGRL